jgi:hypothetical protein
VARHTERPDASARRGRHVQFPDEIAAEVRSKLSHLVSDLMDTLLQLAVIGGIGLVQWTIGKVPPGVNAFWLHLVLAVCVIGGTLRMLKFLMLELSRFISGYRKFLRVLAQHDDVQPTVAHTITNLRWGAAGGVWQLLLVALVVISLAVAAAHASL